MTSLYSLAPGRSECDSKNIIFHLVLLIGIFSSSHDNALWWMPQDLTDDKSTLVQVMAWCRQATSHYLSQCWPRSVSPYGVTRSQWVKIEFAFITYQAKNKRWFLKNSKNFQVALWAMRDLKSCCPRQFLVAKAYQVVKPWSLTLTFHQIWEAIFNKRLHVLSDSYAVIKQLYIYIYNVQG